MNGCQGIECLTSRRIGMTNGRSRWKVGELGRVLASSLGCWPGIACVQVDLGKHVQPHVFEYIRVVPQIL